MSKMVGQNLSSSGEALKTEDGTICLGDRLELNLGCSVHLARENWQASHKNLGMAESASAD
jgi:hypothetical protein